MPGLEPPAPGAVPEVADTFEKIRATGHDILRVLRELSVAVRDPAGEVPLSSSPWSATLRHASAVAAIEPPAMPVGRHHGIDADKLAAVRAQETSPSDEAEGAALEFATAGGTQPNEVTDEVCERIKRSWSDTQSPELVAEIFLLGLMNRFNDTKDVFDTLLRWLQRSGDCGAAGTSADRLENHDCGDDVGVGVLLLSIRAARAMCQARVQERQSGLRSGAAVDVGDDRAGGSRLRTTRRTFLRSDTRQATFG